MTPRYPNAPGSKTERPETSRQAAPERGAAARLRSLALSYVEQSGGCTADECAAALGESVLAVRPRFSELVALGKLEDSGQRRRNASGKSAAVWRVAAPKAERQAEFALWPCSTCGAKDFEDAGDKCIAAEVCSADDQRQRDYVEAIKG